MFRSALLFSIILALTNTFAQITAPYSNYFDQPNSNLGWSHYAISGTDDWEFGQPGYSYFSSSTPPNAWVTKLNTFYTPNSESALETPSFDLSNPNETYILKFKHRRKGASGTRYYFEYSVDNGINWILLEGISHYYRRNWQDTNGFQNNLNSSNLESSIVDLRNFQGISNIKFRFRFSSPSSTEKGWLIDDFVIYPEYNNVVATRGDTIKNATKNFTSFDVETSFNFDRTWSIYYHFTNNVYWSEDTILDNGDSLLGTYLDIYNSDRSNWNHTFNMPPNVTVGDHYIIHQFDVNDTLEESDETDNINFTVLQIDSLFEPPMNFNFDTTEQYWNTSPLSEQTNWTKGWTNNWHIESSHSGENAWITSFHNTSYFNNHYLESPYLDLTNSTNTVACFWYNYSGIQTGTISYLRFATIYNNSEVTYPNITNSYSANNLALKKTRLYGWDCACKDISNYDGNPSTKIAFDGSGYTDINSISQIAIDDVYIGPARPDISIGNDIDKRFTDESTTVDSLKYLVFNSGLATLDPTTTEFYWSIDTILDTNDILLGSNIEPSIIDTNYVWNQFVYSKPSIANGKFYIIYKADALNEIVEMREYNNIGYFTIHETEKKTLPYSNDFESNIDGWRQKPTLGYDQWLWGTPDTSSNLLPYSGQKAFYTKESSALDSNNRLHLYTPIFDLTQLENPTLEFNLNHFRNPTIYHSEIANIMFSRNGGATWEVLDTSNLSFKRFNYRLVFESINGSDKLYNSEYNVKTLYGKNLKTLSFNGDYQGRDYDNDNYHHILNLEYLKNEKSIQFMFVFAYFENIANEILLDDFEIKEGYIDLLNPSEKMLLTHSVDKVIQENLKIRNVGTMISNPTSLKIYLSQDSIIDSYDYSLDNIQVPSIRPSAYYNFKINTSTPANNYNSYNYLLFQIDPNNTNIEENETNNYSSQNLAMDSSKNYNYPILYEFNETEVNGWKWYNDGTGLYHGHRFRNHLLIGDYIDGANNGEWFLDPIDLTGSINYQQWYPIQILESPAYDFRFVSNPELSFKFKCYGYNGSNSEGASIEYSTDGGLSWTPLTNVNDPNAVNWFNLNDIASLNDIPGWGYYPNWTTSSINLSFLENTPNVKFRFKSKMKYRPGQHVPKKGFTLDNFQINGNNITTLPPITICPGDSAFIFNEYKTTAGLYADSSSGTLIKQELIHSTPFHKVENINICSGESITLNNGLFVSNVNTSFTNIDSTMCDTIFVSNVNVLQPILVTININICSGEDVTLNNGLLFNNITAPFTYIDTSVCDTTYITNVNIPGPININYESHICRGESITLNNGMTFNNVNTSFNLSDTMSCDTTFNFEVIVHKDTLINETVQVCSGDSYIFPDGSVANNITNSINYTSHLISYYSCDSTINTAINIQQPSSSYLIESSCNNYTSPLGYLLTSSGIYHDTLVNYQGCDSIITIDLTINQPTSSYINDTACNSYSTNNGLTFNSSGTYQYILPNSLGCDSIVILNLVINTLDTSVNVNGITLESNETNGNYQWYDCTAQINLHNDTLSNYTPNTNGEYAVIINNSLCIDTSECITINSVNLEENDFNRFIKIYPNPTLGKLNLELDSKEEKYEITFYNNLGQTIWKKEVIGSQFVELRIEQPKGIYLLEIKNRNKTKRINIVKQ